jgi:8-oxo-dGTP diphosphatase
MIRSLCLLLLTPLLIACRDLPPACPFTGQGELAPSAGCFAYQDGKVLLVQYYSGSVSPPGGSAESGEIAQCTAHRETWEETGLSLMPGPRLAVFDTGFHLYQCSVVDEGQAPNGPAAEVRRTLWLPRAELEQVSWRFAGQGEVLRQLIEQLDDTDEREHYVE